MSIIKKDTINFELLNIKLDIISYFFFVCVLITLFSSGILITLFEQIKIFNNKIFIYSEIKHLYTITNFIYVSTFFAMVASFVWLFAETVPKIYINLFYGWNFLKVSKNKIILLLILPITILFCNILTTAFIIIFYYVLFSYWRNKN